MTRIFYKPINSNNIVSTSLSPMLSLNEFLESVGNVDYVLIDDDSAFNKFQECLKIQSGVLSYDITLLKEAVHQVRKEKCQELFKPYDKIISDINALEIPEEFFSGGYVTAKQNAEAQRALIRTQSQIQKTAINNATTASAVLAIYQNIINTN